MSNCCFLTVCCCFYPNWLGEVNMPDIFQLIVGSSASNPKHWCGVFFLSTYLLKREARLQIRCKKGLAGYVSTLMLAHLWCFPWLSLSSLSSVLQPGKLTEAFKYFVQGMGYSEYWILDLLPRPPYIPQRACITGNVWARAEISQNTCPLNTSAVWFPVTTTRANIRGWSNCVIVRAETH